MGDRVAAARLKKEAEARAAELRRSAGVKLRKHVETAPASSAPAGEMADAKVSEAAQSAFADDIAVIRERDRVRIKSLANEGTVEVISDGVYTVLVGSLRFRARREELQLVKSAEALSKRAAQLPRGVSASIRVDEAFSSEINIIGSTVDEATDRVDKFLDEAYVAGADTIRIVHGHGKGALRKAVSDLLTGHPHLEKFRQAPPDQGGAGATIAELRK